MLLVLLFTVIAGLLFSHLSVRPFRRLIVDHSMGQVVPEAHNAIQSLTGMNFSPFLSLTRTQEATRLLRETDESIQQVAARCGYPAISTFYRNSKKHYQVTPAEYKDTLP